MIKKSIVGLVVCLCLLSACVPNTRHPVQDIKAGQAVKAQSYTDLGNGIIQDNVTGLMWQKATAPGTYTWDGAIAYCADLHLGPYTDWRLPTIEELRTLINSNIPYPGPTINTAYFPDTVASIYWSSTSNANRTGNAWLVTFVGGLAGYSLKTGSIYVRAVRSGQ